MTIEKSHRELTAIVRTTVNAVENVGPSSVKQLVEPVREALTARGLYANCRMGCTAEKPEHIVEWYAGQLLDIVDNEAWFAMNSLINALDRFAPELPE